MDNRIIKSVIVTNSLDEMSSFVKKISAIIILVNILVLSTTGLSAQEKQVQFSLTGGVNISNNNFTLSPGVLASIQLIGPFRIEAGYEWNTFKEKSGSEMLTVTNKVNYHTVPIHFTYSWNHFGFVAGPSLHILNNGLLMLGDDSYTYEQRDISGNYQNLFCSLNGGIRYKINNHWSVGVAYNYGVTNRYTSPIFDTPFHLITLNLHYRIFDLF
jgi:opacity protein-like surface antigen